MWRRLRHLWLVHDHAGLNTQARGYEPAGMMFILQYEGYTTKAYEDFLRRIRTYNRVVPETRGSQDGHGGGHEGSGGNEHGGHSH